MNYPEEQGASINLSDYNHEAEIEARLLFDELTSFEAQVLEELLYSSLKTSVEELSESLTVELQPLKEALHSINRFQLFHFNEETLHICKEKRKLLEPLAARLEAGFSPTMQHLVDRLSCVPINLLPRWYSLPQCSEEINKAIIEKFLETPKKYQRQLKLAQEKTPQLEKICSLLYAAPEYKLSLAILMEKLALSPRECHALILELEFHFVCCLTYENCDGKMQPYLSLPEEWAHYLELQAKQKKSPYIEGSALTAADPRTFGFVSDMNKLLRSLLLEPILLDNERQPQEEALLEALGPPLYFKQLLDTLLSLNLAELDGEALAIGGEGDNWLKMNLEEQAMGLYFFHLKCYHRAATPFNDRDVREVERALEKIPSGHWCSIEMLCKNLGDSIGEMDPITLKSSGKRWRYEQPSYGELEKTFVREVITYHLHQCGMVAIGNHNGETCFQVTPFGLSALSH